MTMETAPSPLRFRTASYLLERECRFDESIRSRANVSAVQFAKSGYSSPGCASAMLPVTTTFTAPDAATTPAAGTVRFAPTAIALGDFWECAPEGYRTMMTIPPGLSLERTRRPFFAVSVKLAGTSSPYVAITVAAGPSAAVRPATVPVR